MYYSILRDHFLRENPENLIHFYILVLRYGLITTIYNIRIQKENKWKYISITNFKRCNRPKQLKILDLLSFHSYIDGIIN